MKNKKAYISVLIPDGESHLLRFIVNCLSQERDVKIFVLSTKKSSEMRFSRYVQKYIYQSKVSSDIEWVNYIHYVVEQNNIDVIVPIFETGIKKIIENIDVFKSSSKLCLLPTLNDFIVAGDKGLLFKHLKKHNLPCPKSYVVSSGSLPDNDFDLSFPVIVKPVKGYGGGQLIKKIETPKSLSSFFKRNLSDTDFIIQNFIDGYDICCNVLCKNGGIIAYTFQKDIFNSNGKFSPQIGFKFVEEKDLIYTIKNLIYTLNWSGIANIDCRYDFKDKKFKILEINTRFWVNTEGSALAGVNFPYLLCLSNLKDIVALQKADLISCLNLKGLVFQIKRNPFFVFKFKYIYNNTVFKYILKDPLPIFYKYALRTKNIIASKFIS